MLTDLEAADHVAVLRSMEGFQAELVAITSPVWGPHFAFTGDVLYNFSREWEYPYAWVNLQPRPGRVLDAGSGFTFFPYVLSVAGWRVDCCDTDPSLAAAFETANRRSDRPVGFTAASVAHLLYDDGAFDAVVCISVLEHLGNDRPNVVRELTRVPRPDGFLILTCDLSLSRNSDTSWRI